jgi:uncharacterized protein DUF4129
LTTSRRAGAVGLVLLALGVVAVAARSYRPFADQPPGTTGRAPSQAFVDTTFTIALCVLGLLTLLAILVLPSLRPDRRRGQRASMQGLVAYLLFVVICAAIAGRVLNRPFTRGQEDQPGETVFPGQPPPQQKPSATEQLQSPEVVWPLVIGVGVLVAVAVLAAVIVARRRRGALPSASGSPAALADALDEAIDDLRREPDARKAVVAAYARMEAVLASFGVPRRPAEAPYEYLGRAGREIRAESSMAALTDLFEEAKFSEHAIGEAMRERAIDSLGAVRDEVRAAA